MVQNISLYTPPEFISVLNEFGPKYDLQNILAFPCNQPPILKKKSARVCRFCGLNATSTKFNKKPHVIPFFLGNRYGVSDFECDTCNEYFSVYENHLAYFLGINQSFSGSVSRKGVPTLKSSKKDLEIRAMNIGGVDGLMIQKMSQDSTAIDWSDDDVVSITFSKGSYKPAYVFKILLKIALCTLPEHELQYYRSAFKYLLSKEVHTSSGMASVAIFDFKLGFSSPAPFAYLFKRKETVTNIPSHQFALYFQNKIIEFCLPYNINDMALYNGTHIDVPIAPPLASLPFQENIPHTFSVIDLSSTEAIKGEEQVITFQVDSAQIKNAVGFDPKTGEMVNSSISRGNQKGIFLVPKGTVINPSDFLKKP